MVNNYDKLNEKQKEVVDLIYDVVFNNLVDGTSSYFFIDGPGGLGKTFIYTTLYHILRGEKKTSLHNGINRNCSNFVAGFINIS